MGKRVRQVTCASMEKNEVAACKIGVIKTTSFIKNRLNIRNFKHSFIIITLQVGIIPILDS